MKNRTIAICAVICMMLCINMVPVYGSDVMPTVDMEKTKTASKEINEMPLTPPAAVKTALINGKYVKVTWNKVRGASGYKVYRSTSKNGTYKLQSTVEGTSYTDKKVYKGEGFYYKIRAINSSNEDLKSLLSESSYYLMKPAEPVISARNLNGDIKVSWKKVYGAQKYYVYVYSGKKGKYLKVGETSELTFTHTKAVNNTFIYYKVRAVYFENGKTVAGDVCKNVKILSRHIDPGKKMVALTFDDGPSNHTKAIVKCLFNNNSAATFFVVGNRIDSYKDTVKYTHAMGCELANHSYSHPILTTLSADGIKSEIKKTDKKIKNLTGVQPALVRVPGGGYNSTVKKAVGKPLIQWSDDTLDWKTRSKSATVNYVMKNVSDGDIVLMHDLHEPTKNAALELIPKLKKKGYQIVTVSELAKYKGYKLKNGTVYFSFR